MLPGLNTHMLSGLNTHMLPGLNTHMLPGLNTHMLPGLNTHGALKGPHTHSPAMHTETHQLCTSPLRLNTLKLDELSEELDKRTKETQMLQEEIENATKEAFQKVCCMNGLNPRLHRDTLSVDTDMGSCRDQDRSQPTAYGLQVVRHSFTFPGKEVLENAVEDYSQQVSELQRQINELHDHHEQQKFHHRQTIIQLQTELHQVNTEKDVLSDLRMKDSRRHAGEVEQAQAALCDLRTTQRSGEEKLRQAEEEACVFRREAESAEGTVREVYSTLMAHWRGGGTGAGASTAPGGPGQLVALGRLTVEVLDGLEQERDQLREGLSQALEKLKSEELNHQANAEAMLKEQQDRVEQLIAGHDQQVATLTEKLNSNAALLLELERLQKHAESQGSFHNCQVKELNSVLSTQKDRVSVLEQQLSQALSQADEAQRGRGRLLKQAEELQSQLGQLTEELRQAKEEQGEQKERGRLQEERSRQLQAAVEERSTLARHLHSLLGTVKQDCLAQMEALRSREVQQRWDLQEEVRSLREQLGAAGEEEAEGRRSQTLLPQVDKERTQQEAQQGRAGLETLQKRLETLQKRLEDREKEAQTLRLQLQSAGQMTERQGHVMDGLHREKHRLSQRLARHRAELRHLQASLAEQGRRVQDLTLDRDQLSAQLDRQRAQMLSLAEEQEEVRRLREAEWADQQGVVQQLRDQLKTTQEDLQEARSAMRTLQHADGHGLKLAQGMQRQMTARRQQVDALQSRIQQLQETVETLHQEKHSQSQGRECDLRELASLREQKRRLAEEVETLRSRETQHKDTVRALETALHKMSESFADGQDLLQLREQECVRLKLQHALDLKELQGRDLRLAATVGAPPPTPPPTPPPAPASSHPPAPVARHPSWHDAPEIKDSAAWERPSLARELHAVMSEKPRPRAPQPRPRALQRRPSPGRNPPRRRSAPGRRCGTTPHGSGNEQTSSRRRSDLQEDPTDSPVSCENLIGSRSSTPTRCAPSPPPAVCRSPVHSLLTSDPRNKAASDRLEAAATPPPANPERRVQRPSGREWNPRPERKAGPQTGGEVLHKKNLEISSVIRGYTNKTSPT